MDREQLASMSEKDMEMMGIKTPEIATGNNPAQDITTEKGERFALMSRERLQEDLTELVHISEGQRDYYNTEGTKAREAGKSGDGWRVKVIAEVNYINKLKNLIPKLDAAQTPEELRAIQLAYHEANIAREVDMGNYKGVN